MLPTIVKEKLYVKIKERKLNLQNNSDTELFYVYYAYCETQFKHPNPSPFFL